MALAVERGSHSSSRSFHVMTTIHCIGGLSCKDIDDSISEALAADPTLLNVFAREELGIRAWYRLLSTRRRPILGFVRRA